jgi:hypothetical protein
MATIEPLDPGRILINEIAAVLNDIILSTGQAIDINNSTIWNTYLHKWSNDDWADMLAAFVDMCDQKTHLVKPFHSHACETAVMIMHKNALLKNEPRIMDTKANKRHAWKMIMAMRELSNAHNNINVPNEDMPLRKQVLARQATIYKDLFE